MTEQDRKFQEMDRAKKVSKLIEKTYLQREEEERRFIDMKERAENFKSDLDMMKEQIIQDTNPNRDVLGELPKETEKMVSVEFLQKQYDRISAIDLNAQSKERVL